MFYKELKSYNVTVISYIGIGSILMGNTLRMLQPCEAEK